MIKLVILPLLLFLFPWPTLAQSSPPLATPANECAGLAVAASRAADELTAARELIKAQAAQIEAAIARLEIEKERTALERDRAELLKQQAANLQTALDADRQANEARAKLIETHEKRVAQLEAKIRRNRWLTLAGVAVAAVVLLK